MKIDFVAFIDALFSAFIPALIVELCRGAGLWRSFADAAIIAVCVALFITFADVRIYRL